MITDMAGAVQAGLRQEHKMETISNHLANVNTAGFKAGILTFDEMLRERMTLDLSQGDINATGNPLDLALADKGFFKIQTPAGIRYTRNGNFSLNSDHRLVTSEGYAVLGDNGPLMIDGSDISVNEQGEIRVDGETAGNLAVVDVKYPAKLQKEGASHFRYTGPAAEEIIVPQRVSVRQGHLERSNVTTVVEMVKMIDGMRTYESYQKMIQAIDETDAKAVNEVGKLG